MEPKIPVHMLPQNQELLKAQLGEPQKPRIFETTPVHAVYEGSWEPQYRTPPDRVSGNHMFRRYADGVLDIEYCVHKVVDALHRAKDLGAMSLNTLERVAVSVMFPESFGFVDSSMVRHVAAVQLRISEQEREAIRTRVGLHLAEEMNWNAGMGGSIQNRSTTRA